MYPFYVIEDELGTLALAVYNKNHTELIYLYRFYHMNPGMLQTDLAKLAEGENPETQWDNNELSRSDRDQKERLETWFLEEDQKSDYHKRGAQWQIIASDQGIYPEQRRMTGKRELSESFYYSCFPKAKRNTCQNCPHNRPIFITQIQGDICEGICSPEGCYLADQERF